MTFFTLGKDIDIMAEDERSLEVLRYSTSDDSTLGILSEVGGNGREFLAYTIEDEFREEKVSGKTRIPEGTYEIKLRTTGGFNNRYTAKFGDWHKGMLHVQDVPGFEYILIHTGNTDEDTMGCLLVADTSQQNITKEGFIGASTDAYKRIYPDLAQYILDGNKLTITYIDYDNPRN
jgi:hypothetical protein|tara:strand:- start:7363 stop:7890 length:528 start_codon:yes stop_codon:yes gene_type:complete